MTLPKTFVSNTTHHRFCNTQILQSGYKVINLSKHLSDQERIIIDVRFYTPKDFHSNTQNCYMTIHLKDRSSYSATGKARGLGYHLESQAASIAMHNMGIIIDAQEAFANKGTIAMETAFKTLARTLGYTNICLVGFGH